MNADQLRAIGEAQKVYADCASPAAWAEYDALIEALAVTLGLPVADTYDVVERGPVINAHGMD